MTEAKILPEFLFHTGGYDRRSQAGYIQGHLVEELTVPVLSQRDSLVNFFGKAFQNFLNARIKIMKDRSACPNDKVRRSPLQKSAFLSIQQLQFADFILYGKP